MKRHGKILLVVNVLLLTLLIWISVREKYLQRAYNALFVKEDRNTIIYASNRDELFETLPKDSNAIVFLGDSHTSGFELAELFHSASIKNRGVSGDFTLGVLKRLKPVAACHARKIFIEIGINDIMMEIDKNTIFKNYITILETLKKESPRSEIYIQSILPVSNSTPLSRNYDPVKVNEEIKPLNAQLRAYAIQHKTNYIDLYAEFELNHWLNPKYTIDGVHLNGAGYLLWRDLLKPYID